MVKSLPDDSPNFSKNLNERKFANGKIVYPSNSHADGVGAFRPPLFYGRGQDALHLLPVAEAICKIERLAGTDRHTGQRILR